MSAKWEYRQEIFQGVEEMNKWGAEGWELAGFFGKDGSFMILKRPLRTRGAAAPPPAMSEKPAARSPARAASRSAGPPSGAKKKEMI